MRLNSLWCSACTNASRRRAAASAEDAADALGPIPTPPPFVGVMAATLTPRTALREESCSSARCAIVAREGTTSDGRLPLLWDDEEAGDAAAAEFAAVGGVSSGLAPTVSLITIASSAASASAAARRRPSSRCHRRRAMSASALSTATVSTAPAPVKRPPPYR